jgi:hypothetical protein
LFWSLYRSSLDNIFHANLNTEQKYDHVKEKKQSHWRIKINKEYLL